jgi:hypothetical protein
MNEYKDLDMFWSDTRFYHLRVGGGVITAFTSREPLNPEGRKVIMGFSLCSPKDSFQKQFGRLVASGRAVKKPIFATHSGSTLTDVKNYIINNLNEFPSWVRRNVDEIRM